MPEMRCTRAVEVTAPTRVDLAGGTVDIWPLYLFHREAVTLNAAIELRARVILSPGGGSAARLVAQGQRQAYTWRVGDRIRRRGRHELFLRALEHFSVQGGLQVDYAATAPMGAGLAGSSTMLAAFSAGLMKSAGLTVHKGHLPFLLRDIETRLIEVPAGMQDYYPAVWGGIQALWWECGNIRREVLTGLAEALENRMVLVYTGTSRHSGMNNWEVCKRHLDGDAKVRRMAGQIVDAAQQMYAGLKARDFQAVGDAMASEAAARTRLFPGIETPEIRTLSRLMALSGATATKVCGAGGGGCVVVYAEPEVRSELAALAETNGYRVLPFRIARRGLVFNSATGRRWTAATGSRVEE